MKENIAESLLPLVVDIASVKTDKKNNRQHPVRNLEALQKSLEAYGQRKPIVVNSETHVIEAGNGLYMAAFKLGWTKIAAVMVKDDPNTAKGYAIMDNQSGALSEWDLPNLSDLLKELGADNYDMTLTGFDDKEIAKLTFTENAGLTDPDDVPDEVETVCKKGDLWQLGNHRLLCGDSTKPEDVKRLMNGEKADMVFTDPPYGMNLDTDYSKLTSKNSFASGKKHAKVIGDESRFDASFIIPLAEEVVLFGADYYIGTLPEYGESGSWMVWDKRADESQDKGFGSNFELLWSKQKHKRWMLRHNWFGFFTGGEKREYSHPTEKPVSLLTEVLNKLNASSVLDLFGGSGSTLIACEKLNRRCFMMEIAENYCGVIIARYEAFTGKKAVKL